jgi:hypothetical protein
VPKKGAGVLKKDHNVQKMGQLLIAGGQLGVVDPWSGAQSRPATSGCPPAAGRHLRLWDSSNFFDIFLFLKKEFLEV